MAIEGGTAVKHGTATMVTALPAGWSTYHDAKSGKQYYHDGINNLSTWKQPSDAVNFAGGIQIEITVTVPADAKPGSHLQCSTSDGALFVCQVPEGARGGQIRLKYIPASARGGEITKVKVITSTTNPTPPLGVEKSTSGDIRISNETSFAFKKMMVRGVEVRKRHSSKACVVPSQRGTRILFMDPNLTNINCGKTKERPTKSIPLITIEKCEAKGKSRMLITSCRSTKDSLDIELPTAAVREVIITELNKICMVGKDLREYHRKALAGADDPQQKM